MTLSGKALQQSPPRLKVLPPPQVTGIKCGYSHIIHWAVCATSMVDHCLGSPFDGWLNHFGLGSFPLQDSWGRPWIPNLYATDFIPKHLLSKQGLDVQDDRPQLKVGSQPGFCLSHGRFSEIHSN